MTRPTLSVLMANYNHARFLPESLGAILSQDYDSFEVIVIDDGSTDGSVDLLKQWAQKHPNFRFLQNDRNRGVLFTTGRLIQEARGEYFCFCAADDRVLPGFFSQSLTLLGQHPQAGACTALVRLMGENGDDQGLFQPLVISGDNSFIEPKRAAEILRRHGTWYMGPAAIYRRGAFLDSGGLIAELGPMCDDFLFMVCALKFGVCHIPKPLAVWRKMEGTYSKTTSANRQKMRGIINHAVELMETTYRDIFPRDLIRRLRGRWLFSMETQQSSPVVRLIFFALLRPLDIIPFLARRLNLRNARV